MLQAQQLPNKKKIGSEKIIFAIVFCYKHPVRLIFIKYLIVSDVTDILKDYIKMNNRKLLF